MMKRCVCFLLSALMVLLLAACTQEEAVSAQAGPPAPLPAKAARENAEIVKVQNKKKPLLYIGLGSGRKLLITTAERSVEALLAALAEETGWNLSVKSITADQPERGYLTIAFAADSAIYANPPNHQKDAYRVQNAEDWVYTVLDSVANTLTKNLKISGVAFASPDGGDVETGNASVTLHLNKETAWAYENVWMGNEPLPEDSLGMVVLWPQYPQGGAQAYSPGGVDTLALTFQRPGVTLGSGTLTVYNEDGTVFDTVSAERMAATAATPEQIRGTHFQNATQVTVALNKVLELGHAYFVGLEEGTFVAGNISNKAFAKENWKIVIENYGIASDSFPVSRSKTVQLGGKVTYNVVLGEAVLQCTITPEDPARALVSTEKLTADGSITITPQKAGTLILHIRYVLRTGGIVKDSKAVTVVE